PVLARRPDAPAPSLVPSPQLFSTRPAPTALYPLSLHDALPICLPSPGRGVARAGPAGSAASPEGRSGIRGAGAAAGTCRRSTARSEEHTSELQSRFDLVCRLLLEKKKRGERRDTAREWSAERTS